MLGANYFLSGLASSINKYLIKPALLHLFFILEYVSSGEFWIVHVKLTVDVCRPKRLFLGHQT